MDASTPTQGQLRAFARRVGPPENEVPAVLAVRHVLARRPGLVLSLLGARVHTTGVLLDLDVRLERRPTPEQAAGLHEWVRPLSGDDVRADQRLALRFTFADGRAVALEDLRSGSWSAEREARYADPDVLVLRASSAGTAWGARAHNLTLWLSPLPPAGPVVFSCSWPSLDVAAREVVLDGGVLLEAAAHAEVLWPVVEDATPDQLSVRYDGGYVPLGPLPADPRSGSA